MRIRIKLLGRLVAILVIVAALLPAGCSSPTENDVVDMFTTPPPDDLGLKVTVEVDEEAGTVMMCISFAIPRQTDVYFEICNATGFTVWSRFWHDLEAGQHDVCWDCTNGDGEPVKSGLYLLHLVAGEFEDWKVYPLCLTAEDCEEMFGDGNY